MPDDFRLQISVKTRNDDLINVRGATPQEFETALAYAEANMTRLIELGNLAKAITNLQDAGLNPQPVGNATSGYIQPAPPQPPQQSWGQPQAAGAPTGPRPSCIHGEHKWVPAGVSKNPPYKPYSGFFTCPAPRGQQCPKNAA